jgi:hypothetical protein
MATKSNGKTGKTSGEPGKLKEYQPGQAFNGVIGRTLDTGRERRRRAVRLACFVGRQNDP